MNPTWNPGTTPPDSTRIVVGVYDHIRSLSEWGEVKFFRYEGEDGWCDLDDPDCTCKAPDFWIDLPEVRT